MSAGWVAGGVRGRLLCRRRLGMAGARAIATAGSAGEAVAALARSPYGHHVRTDMSTAQARRAIGAVCLWHLRVLAGWLPPRAGEVVRVFAGRFELVNIGDRIAALSGEAPPPPYELGALAVAWPRVAAASTPQGVREALAGSVWGDPRSLDWPSVEATLHARWARWLADTDADTSVWAAGAAALVAAQLLVAGTAVAGTARADLRGQLGAAWEAATDLPTLADRLPRAAAWVLDGIDEPSDLWRAEGAWWQRVDLDAARTLRQGRPGRRTAAAAAAQLSADAWRAQAALEAGAWGAAATEAFDAVA